MTEQTSGSNEPTPRQKLERMADELGITPKQYARMLAEILATAGRDLVAQLEAEAAAGEKNTGQAAEEG